MKLSLNVDPQRIAPARMYFTVATVAVAHALALWVVANEIAELPASHTAVPVLLADVVSNVAHTNPQNMPASFAPAPRKVSVLAQASTAGKPAQMREQMTHGNDTPHPSPTSISAPARAQTHSTGTLPAETPRVVEPSAHADYLNNPPPAYPRTSRRLGEQGIVLVRVFINAQGIPEKYEVHVSSGFARLDHAALEAVERWRFVPAHRGGVPEAMWFNIPVRFILE